MREDVMEVEDEPVAVTERAPSQVEFKYRYRIQALEKQRDAWDLEKQAFLGHIRDLHYRNDLLQQRLDQAIGENARRQADAMDTVKVEAAPERRQGIAKKEQAVLRVATYRVAMQSIGRPATAKEIAHVLGYKRDRVYNWLINTGKKHGVVSTVEDHTGFQETGRPSIYFSWPPDTKAAP